MRSFCRRTTLQRRWKRRVREIPRDIVDTIILTDDCSKDETVRIAQQLGLVTLRHDKNRGYGGNQKTCYACGAA